MHSIHPSPQPDGPFPEERLLSRDEVVGLLVAIVCAAGCMLLLLGLPAPALAEEDADVPETQGDQAPGTQEDEGSAQIADAMAGLVDGIGAGAPTATAPAPSDSTPLIVVLVIMGVALAIAFAVSRSHAKPQKLGGAKGDVW